MAKKADKTKGKGVVGVDEVKIIEADVNQGSGEVEQTGRGSAEADTVGAGKETDGAGVAESSREGDRTAVEPAEDKPKFTKSGKKSKKHFEEAVAEEQRRARKADQVDEDGEKKAGPRPKTRTRLERRGKKYRAVAGKVEKGKVYPLAEAIQLALDTCPASFDTTLEAHFRLGVDPRQADQNIRATVSLPNGSGKTVRVAVFAPSDVLKAAGEADIAEDEEFLKRLDKEQLDFDVLITTPQFMPKLGKYARLLGPKGLMPNPKAGTVTSDVTKAVKELKGGKIEYRVDKQGIVHVGLGKSSFGAEKLLGNVTAFLESLKAQKPASVKGSFVKSFYLTTTMGPSVQVENTLN